jgi:putative oxidoreductase
LLGIGTRLAAIPPLVTMIVASGLVHASDPWPRKELPILYGVAFLTLALAGGGRFGLGGLFKPRWLRT